MMAPGFNHGVGGRAEKMNIGLCKRKTKNRRDLGHYLSVYPLWGAHKG